METKFYFLYKTTNLKNGKFYIGVHETYDLDDGYLGSGKRFRNSLYYHGKENFKREILEYFDNSKSMYDRELEIVNEEFLKNPECLNIGLGGKGGFTLAQCKKGAHRMNEIIWNDVEFIERNRKRNSDMFKEWWKTDKFNKQMFSGENNRFYGKQHSDESKRKMRKSKNVGNSNSQYGTRWITNGVINKKIKKEDNTPSGFILGRTIQISSNG